VTTSFSVTVGITATPLVSPNWVNGLALAAPPETANFIVTTEMLAVMVPYNGAAAATASIQQGLTTDIGAFFLVGQVGANPVTVVPWDSTVTVTGQTETLGPNHVLCATQLSQDVWDVETYSWVLSQCYGNPNAQPLIVAYGLILFTNGSAVDMLVDTEPTVAWGGDGTLIPAGQSFSQYYGSGPAELWYGVVETTPSVLSVMTGPPSGNW
jgi:hypothetical protein